MPATCCAICFFDCNNHSFVLACGHPFHHKCLRRWFLRGPPSCPLCRQHVDGCAELLLDNDDDWQPEAELLAKPARPVWRRVDGRIRRGR